MTITSIKSFKQENQQSNLYKKQETLMNYINKRQLLNIRILIHALQMQWEKVMAITIWKEIAKFYCLQYLCGWLVHVTLNMLMSLLKFIYITFFCYKLYISYIIIIIIYCWLQNTHLNKNTHLNTKLYLFNVTSLPTI